MANTWAASDYGALSQELVPGSDPFNGTSPESRAYDPAVLARRSFTLADRRRARRHSSVVHHHQQISEPSSGRPDIDEIARSLDAFHQQHLARSYDTGDESALHDSGEDDEESDNEGLSELDQQDQFQEDQPFLQGDTYAADLDLHNEITEPGMSTETSSLLDTASEEEATESYTNMYGTLSVTDDPSINVNTLRMWTITMTFSIFGSMANLIFSLRYPSITITPIIALLAAHPMGRMWDRIFPELPYVEGAGVKYTLKYYAGQGRWNRKEHAIVYVGANVSFGFAYATDIIVEQVEFYGTNFGFLYQILLIMSTQITGYAFAGIARSVLVTPPSMVWPSTVMSCSLFSTLHSDVNLVANGWRISKLNFFSIVFVAGFCWYWIPGLLFPALSNFNAITWLKPSSKVIASLFGTHSGLGMLPLSFDWAQISYTGSPFLTPWWAQVNVLAGLVIFMWIGSLIVYYTNSFYSGFMPILSSSLYDRWGNIYDITKVIRSSLELDLDAYRKFSPVYLSATYILSYALQFASIGALSCYTMLYHGMDIWRLGRDALLKSKYVPTRGNPFKRGSRTALRGMGRGSRARLRGRSHQDSHSNRHHRCHSKRPLDIHDRLMRRYPPVPSYWFWLILVTCVATGAFMSWNYKETISLRYFFLAVSAGALTFLPISLVYAVSNQLQSTYLVIQILAGYLLPNNPIGNMTFLGFGYITATQGLKFASDMKIGHYMKIPPRILFWIQLISTVVASLVQLCTLNLMIKYIPDMCYLDAESGFSCPIARVHFNGTVLWALIGPSRFFVIYWPVIIAFPLGMIAVLFVWIMYRRHPKSIWRFVNIPIMLGSLTWIPPATGFNISSWAIVGYMFNSVIFRKYNLWWRKYVMTLSAGLDSSLAVSALAIFIFVVYPGLNKRIDWWGTRIFKEGCDWKGCTSKNLNPGESFGPDHWN